MKYKTILVDPPWQQKMAPGMKRRPNRPTDLPYPTMSVGELGKLPIPDLAEIGCHLWLWTTNQFLPSGFDLLHQWGFKYLSPITWVKPSGCGSFFVSRTQTVLFAYRERCLFPLGRYKPTVLFANAGKHSVKPEASYDLIESISPEPRLEMFARKPRNGWTTIGDEIDGKDIHDAVAELLDPPITIMAGIAGLV